jgi:hypothetical protein
MLIGKRKTLKESTKKKGPRTPPSIPSKFHSQNSRNVTLVKDNEKATFRESNDKSTRRKLEWNDKSIKKSMPGPGQYRNDHTCAIEAYRKGSISSRGYTPIISLDPRFGSDIEEMKNQLYPGPGTYMPDISASKPSGPKTNFGYHGTAGSKRKLKRKTRPSPGPGSYKLNEKPMLSNLGAASFKFTARKDSDLLLQQDTKVAVGSYDVGAVYDFMDRLGKEPRKGKDFPDPIFRSQTSRLAPTESTSLAPAPGYYEVIEYQDRDKLYRPSACFNSGLDRCGNSINVRVPRAESPGPDSYRPNQLAKKDSLGAVASFASSSARLESSVCKEDRPGPQSYHPLSVSRKSFLQNRYCQWV